jgi:hypothetical protein
MSNPKYEALLKEREQKILDLKETKRKQLLEKHHLYEEVEGPKSEDYPFYRWENNQVIYYKKVYENVSDEELSYLDILCDQEQELSEKISDDYLEETRSVSFIATIVVGYFSIIFGIIRGIFYLLTEREGLGFTSIVAGIIAGIAFLTAAHIIRQLNIIINNLNKHK